MERQFVTIPVPADRVEDVYAVLARPKTPVAPTEVKAEDPQGGPQAQSGGLDEALIVRAYRESPDGMRAVFDYLADHPDKDVGMGELAKGTNRDNKKLSGVLGAYGRRKQNRYGKKDAWPYAAWWDYLHGHAVYRMPAEVAVIITKARGG